MTLRRRQRIHTCHYPGCKYRTTADRPMCSMHWSSLSPEERGLTWGSRKQHNDCELKQSGGGIQGMGAAMSLG